MSVLAVSRSVSAVSSAVTSGIEDEETTDTLQSPIARLSELEEEEIGEIEFKEDGAELWLSEELDEDDAKRLKSIKDLNLKKPLKLVKSFNELLEPELYVTLCKKFHVTPIANYQVKSIANEFDASLRAFDSKGILPLCKALALNTCVTDLNLSRNCIDGAAAQFLVELMSTNYFISTLDLSGNKLSCGGAEPIREMLSSAIGIKVLNLSSNKLSEKHIRVIFQGVQQNKTLEVLNLSRNALGKEGAVVLGRELAKNTSIKCLDLSWNEIFGKGATVLINALKNNSTLKIIKLGYNGFRDINATFISAVLRCNDVLTELDLTANRMTGTGASRIAKGLAKNETLQILRLAKNPIGTKAAIQLLECGKTTLKELDLSGVLVNKDFLTATRHARKMRGFELIVKYGWSIRGIHNTKCTKTGEVRNNEHPLELMRNTLWDNQFDIKDVLIMASGPISKPDFLQLFVASNCGMRSEDVERLYDVLEEEQEVDIDILLNELEEADEDIHR